jgi:hypothetical protein
MPTEWRGQMITFAIEVDEDLDKRLKGRWVKIGVRRGDTVRKICARRGHPEDVKAVVKRNRHQKHRRAIRSGRTLLRHYEKPRPAKYTKPEWRKILKKDRHFLLVPPEMRMGLQLSVLAGDTPPKPTNGYAKFDTIDRPERTGLTRFVGYDPFTIEVPIQFEAWTDQGGRVQGFEGEEIERKILLLERMAGRGDAYGGAGVGPPPVVRISATDAQGHVVPLISSMFQWTPQSNAPLWRIAGIDWDDDALRSGSGNRVRQKATVSLQQHTRLKLATRSARVRHNSRK